MRAVARDDAFESRDLEVDATYEAWALAHGDGIAVTIPQLGPTRDMRSMVVHHYDDAYSMRIGGSTNHRIGEHVLSLRAGGFYDASTTRNAWTRVDVDTLDKLALTAGVSYRMGALRFTAAIAEVFELERVVRDGQIRSANGARGGSSTSATGEPLPVINDGTYQGHQHVFALGAEVSFGR